MGKKSIEERIQEEATHLMKALRATKGQLKMRRDFWRPAGKKVSGDPSSVGSLAVRSLLSVAFSWQGSPSTLPPYSVVPPVM